MVVCHQHYPQVNLQGGQGTPIKGRRKDIMAQALERANFAVKATVTTSRWETERVNAGVSGIGSYSVTFTFCGVTFSTFASPSDPFVNDSLMKRDGTGYRDNWTGATCGNYSHEAQLTKQQVKSLLARIFEYDDGQPLNAFRFREHMAEAIRAYARIENKSLRDFLDKCYPEKCFREDAQQEYDNERRRIYEVFDL